MPRISDEKVVKVAEEEKVDSIQRYCGEVLLPKDPILEDFESYRRNRLRVLVQRHT